MKIAITGHTAGIGPAFTKILKSRGHKIIGIIQQVKSIVNTFSHNENIKISEISVVYTKKRIPI